MSWMGHPQPRRLLENPTRPSGWMRKGRLFTQERLGVLACEAGHGQQFYPFLALGDRDRDHPVVHLGELGRTAWTERDHADASGLAEVLTSDRHLVSGLA